MRTYLDDHPSVRRCVELGIANDAALARRIRHEGIGRPSVEAIAVALRRVERAGSHDPLAPLAVEFVERAGSLQLVPGYGVLRLRDEDPVWNRLGELRRVLAGTQRPPSVLLHVEEASPCISILAPEGLLPRARRVVPTRYVVSDTRGFALVVVESDAAARDTPGVLAALSGHLSDRGLVPPLLVAAEGRFTFAAPADRARAAFASLRELGRAAPPAPVPSEPLSGGTPGRNEEAGVVGNGGTNGRTGAEVARDYIATHPSVADGLAYGIVNFTALARRIAGEVGYGNATAVEAALRRWRGTRVRDGPEERRLLEVVHGSRIEVRTRVALVNAPHTWRLVGRILESGAARAPDRRRLFQVLQSPTSVTLLCDEELVDPVLRSVGPRSSISAEHGLAAIIVRSPASIVETPGVLAYLSQALARAALNCVELMSVQLESTFVLRQRDALDAFRVLSEVVHPAERDRPGAA